MGWKNRLVFDIAESFDENDNIGAFLRDAAGDLITSQVNGSQQALDVGINVAGVQVDPRDTRALTNADVVTAEQGTSPWVVSATDLDIRDLAFATDSVDVSGSSVSITGDVNVTQGTSPWVVSATDLDIRDLAFATDKVDASGSVVALDAPTLAALESITVQNGAGAAAVNIQDGGNSITVDASDLDIRDLDAAQDSVASWTNDGSGNPISSTGGALDVNITNSLTVDINGVYDVGTNPTPDNVGIISSTRSASPSDTTQTFRSSGAAASSDAVVAADVQGLDVNSFGMSYNGTTWDRIRSRNNELIVNDTANIAILNTQKNVTTSTGALLGSQLANRKYLLIQNAGSGTIYIGASGVSVANGFPIGAGSVAELRCGPAVSVHAVTNSGTRDGRILELS